MSFRNERISHRRLNIFLYHYYWQKMDKSVRFWDKAPAVLEMEETRKKDTTRKTKKMIACVFTIGKYLVCYTQESPYSHSRIVLFTKSARRLFSSRIEAPKRGSPWCFAASQRFSHSKNTGVFTIHTYPNFVASSLWSGVGSVWSLFIAHC